MRNNSRNRVVLFIKFGVLLIFVSVIIPIVWEWLSLKLKLAYSFSWFADIVINNLCQFWEFLGKVAAMLASILELLDINKFLMAIQTVMLFWARVFTSWWWFFTGFFDYLKTVDYPILGCIVAWIAMSLPASWIMRRKYQAVWESVISLTLGIAGVILIFLFIYYHESLSFKFTDQQMKWFNDQLKKW